MSEKTPSARRRLPLLLVGAALALSVPHWPGLVELEDAARAAAAVVWMTAWCWLTGALPLPVASLLPAILLPATGVLSAREVAPLYFPDILLLFLGGFLLAIALERHELHRRFAARALLWFGARPRSLILGFMFLSAALSMFISNTSTAILMLPVAMAVLDHADKHDSRRLAPPLLLGIAYACSIGGTGTPVGTAPNAVFLGQMRDRFPEAPEISFGTWMMGSLPFVVVLVLLAWWMLVRVVHRVGKEAIPGLVILREQSRALGKLTSSQGWVLAIFVGVAVAWLTRQSLDFGPWVMPGWSSLLPEQIASSISDATVALTGAALLFVLPDRSRSTALLEWEDTLRLPWGVLLLLGGGFALAAACESSGLAAALGSGLGNLVSSVSPVMAAFLVALTVTFLTEITSNTASITLLLPLLFSAAVAAGLHPLVLALPATFAVSCAFMLPVATPPNAIVFGSGRITIPQMARAGLSLNLLAATVVTAATLFWIAPAWGYDLTVFPDWARPPATPSEVIPR